MGSNYTNNEFRERFAELEKVAEKKEQQFWIAPRLEEILRDLATVKITYALEILSILHLISRSTKTKIGALFTEILISQKDDRQWSLTTGMQLQKGLHYAGVDDITEIRRVSLDDENELIEDSFDETILILEYEELNEQVLVRLEELHRTGCLFGIMTGVKDKNQLKKEVGLDLKYTVRDMQVELLADYGVRIASLFDVRITKEELKCLLYEWESLRHRSANRKTVEQILRLEMMRIQIANRECSIYDLEDTVSKGNVHQITDSNDDNSKMVSANADSQSNGIESPRVISDKQSSKQISRVKRMLLNLKNWFFE